MTPVVEGGVEVEATAGEDGREVGVGEEEGDPGAEIEDPEAETEDLGAEIEDLWAETEDLGAGREDQRAGKEDQGAGREGELALDVKVLAETEGAKAVEKAGVKAGVGIDWIGNSQLILNHSKPLTARTNGPLVITMWIGQHGYEIQKDRSDLLGIHSFGQLRFFYLR